MSSGLKTGLGPTQKDKPSRNSTPDFDALRELFRHHIESFNYLAEEGLEKALLETKPLVISDPSSSSKIHIAIVHAKLYPPMRDGKLSQPLYPHECRQARTTYKGELTVTVCFKCSSGFIAHEKISLGSLPIMLKSNLCNLKDADRQELNLRKEEACEMGGYFICNGLERLARPLIIQKRNYPIGMVRKSYCKNGDGYTDKAVSMRCVREDQSAVTIKLYYLKSGSARLGFWLKRQVLLPVGIVLKALTNASDREIFVSLTSCYKEKCQKEKGSVATQLIGERALIILREVRELSLLNRTQCLKHIGHYFQPHMDGYENESLTAVAEAVLNQYIFVHLSYNHEKFNLLIFMLQKLFALVDETVVPDNDDALQNQEILLPGHLITIYTKEKVQEWLNKSKRQILDEINKKEKSFDLNEVAQVKKIFTRNSGGVGRDVERMIKLGKLATTSGLDLKERDGLTIQPERINYLRFLSHFRSVHRGASMAKLRTTSVRKLLPESWGFLCPVHTPDGEPCGLLNHMTCSCRISSFYHSDGKTKKNFAKIRSSILTVLEGIGMTHLGAKLECSGPPEILHVLLDGCVVGFISSSKVEEAVAYIRSLKVAGLSVIPDDLEVGYVPLTLGGTYPGLFLFTSPSRFIRPVKNLSQSTAGNSNIELIGPFEQVYMEIRCADGGDGGRRKSFPPTHEEINPTAILSVVANLTPWSDHNQSPRNMYQCQMAKQTMGFASQALEFRSDVKSYNLQTPQSPIVRTAAYSKYCIDEHPTGTNAIVAVLSYTGYDMEDAMILNKSSVDRGMFRGHIYQTEAVDLSMKSGQEDRVLEIFAGSNQGKTSSSVDSDGLPYVGQMIHPNETLYSSYNTLTGTTRYTKQKGSEPVIVDYVSADNGGSKNYLQKVNIRTRCPRNPIIGDKFSSRHGQKGVCSQLWPDVDMPFSHSTGMRPDLIINPHAFPSRMTIGMLLESIAAKGGSLNGKFMDATPFASSVSGEDEADQSNSSSLVDELGQMLVSCGFNYNGSEELYSGVYGTALTYEIFIGPVYYQRLRHMVSDKFQVRSTGVVDQITRQPIGGRKHGGGIRFGEMERDAVLAHGAAYLLHDRLHSCSDYHIQEVCSYCGSILTAIIDEPKKRTIRSIRGFPPSRASKSYKCHSCKTGKGMETVAMPYVFKYLAAELAAMNIKMHLRLSNQVES